MNKTLFSCGFKKQVETRIGRKYDVTSSQALNVKLKKKSIPCKFCSATFTGEQYLNTHLQFKHKSETNDVIPTMLPTLEKFKDKEENRDCTDLVKDDACIMKR